MLNIRHDQIQILARDLQDRFKSEIQREFAALRPDLALRETSADFAARATQAALELDLKTDIAVLRYVNVAAALGLEFQTQCVYPWARRENWSTSISAEDNIDRICRRLLSLRNPKPQFGEVHHQLANRKKSYHTNTVVLPCGGRIEKSTQLEEPRNFIGFRFFDYLGQLVESEYRLVLPDGSIENGFLSMPQIYKEEQPDGEYTVLLPYLSMRWAETVLVVNPDGTGPDVHLEIESRLLQSKTPARIVIYRQFLDEEGQTQLVVLECDLPPFRAGVKPINTTVVCPSGPLVADCRPGSAIEVLAYIEHTVNCAGTPEPLRIVRPPEPTPWLSNIPPVTTSFIEFQFENVFEQPVASSFLLQRPDGSFESGDLDGGTVSREDVPDGEYKAYLPTILMKWSESWIAVDSEATIPSAELLVTHRALAPRSALSLAIYQWGADHDSSEPLWQSSVLLESNKNPTQAVSETVVMVPLDSFVRLVAGEAISLVCYAEHPAVPAGGTEPLIVYRGNPPSQLSNIPPADTPFIEFRLQNIFDQPVQSAFLLERPDGSMQRGDLDEGSVFLEDVPDGEYKVHVPAIVMKWSTSSVTLDSESAMPDVELLLRHVALPTGGVLRLAIYRFCFDDESTTPLWQLDVPLEPDIAHPQRPSEKSVPVPLGVFLRLAPGEATSLVCSGVYSFVPVSGTEELTLYRDYRPEVDRSRW